MRKIKFLNGDVRNFKTLRGVDLRGADFRGADLRFADFRFADLFNANLEGADLWGTIGNGDEIKSFQGLRWNLTWTSTHLWIGCHGHSIEDWEAFDDAKINAMDKNALALWKEKKEFIMNLVKGC